MKRKLLSLGSAVSLLLCVAVASLWARARWVKREAVTVYQLYEDRSYRIIRSFDNEENVIAFSSHRQDLDLAFLTRRSRWEFAYDLRATPERCPECGTTGTIPASS